MSSFQDKILDIRRRIAEEKLKWGFTEEQPLVNTPKEVTQKQPSEADDLKAMLLNRKKTK